MSFWGAPISATGHAVVIGLALWGLPWLRARPEPPPPVMSVSLVTPEDFARIARGASAPPAAVATPDPSRAPAAQPVVRLEATVPHPEAPPAEPLSAVPPSVPETFAGSFDPAAPLGIPALRREPPVGQDDPPEDRTLPLPHRPAASDGAEARRGAAGEDARTAGAVAGYHAAVRAAVERARVYPKVARDRGLFGTARVTLTLAPSGHLESVRLTRSSGAKLLDDATLAAVRNARMPTPPPGLSPADLTYDLGISFTLNGN